MDKRAPAAVSLASLRGELDKEKIDAYILSTYDAHSSEYPAERFRRVAAVSSFGGSVGTVVVTRDRALLFCDPRYWEEAANTMAAGFELVKEGGQDRVTYKTWLREHLPRGARLGYDPEQLTVERLDDLTKALPSAHVVPVEGNLVDRLWPAQPALSAKGCWPHPESLAGETASRKLARLRAELVARRCTAAVLSALDQSMWLLNLRGADSYESPVVYCYTLVTAATAKIYILDWKRVPSEVGVILFSFSVLTIFFPARRLRISQRTTCWWTRTSSSTRTWRAWPLRPTRACGWSVTLPTARCGRRRRRHSSSRGRCRSICGRPPRTRPSRRACATATCAMQRPSLASWPGSPKRLAPAD
jgi:hypothetical protein